MRHVNPEVPDMATPLEQLDAMHHVPENWDGYGGLPPRPEAVREATAFLTLLAGAHPEMANPYVTPAPDGGVLFAWDKGPHSLEVHFDPVASGIEVGFVYLNTVTNDSASGVLRDVNRGTTIPFPLRQLVVGITADAA